jgi:hypothetical protein
MRSGIEELAASRLVASIFLCLLSENGLKTHQVRPKIPRGLSLHPQIPKAQIKCLAVPTPTAVSVAKKISIGYSRGEDRLKNSFEIPFH